MIIIVGLGNKGGQYKGTPHNFGFAVLDAFQEKNEFPTFKLEKKLDAEVSEGIIGIEKVLLVKPQIFMNSSGIAVKKTLAYYKEPAENLVVIHDDLDLNLGSIKIVKNRGSAGHKGIESTIKEIKTEDFARIRLGILPKEGKPQNPEKYVLKKFGKEERTMVERAESKATNAIEALVNGGLEKAMNEYNK